MTLKGEFITNSDRYQPASAAFEFKVGMIGWACYSDPGKQGGPIKDAWVLPIPRAGEMRLRTILAITFVAGGLPGGMEASKCRIK